MKRYLALLFISISFLSKSQGIHIPDNHFKIYLLEDSTINTNGDNIISIEEAENYEGSIFLEMKSVRSLKGIEHFIRLTYLNISSNHLTKLDLSRNNALQYLDCSRNNIKEIDLREKNDLIYFDCSKNNLASIDVQRMSNLETLKCKRNRLMQLNITGNHQLSYLDCGLNKLTNLEVKHLPNLEYLMCESNDLKELNVSFNKQLQVFNCSGNKFSTNLDLSWNKKLVYINCKSNCHIPIVFIASRELESCCYNKSPYTHWFVKTNNALGQNRMEENLSDSIVIWNNEMRTSVLRKEIPKLFYYSSERGAFYAGVTNQYELSCYSLGGELKRYGSINSPWLSASVYTNYRHLFVGQNTTIPSNAVSIGAHASILGLEATSYFTRDQQLYYLTPKIGFDTGSFSFFYGYSLSLNKSDFKGVYGHNVSFKYSLYLGAFKNIARQTKHYKI